jgi:hypothetical protein
VIPLLALLLLLWALSPKRKRRPLRAPDLAPPYIGPGEILEAMARRCGHCGGRCTVEECTHCPSCGAPL